MMARYNFTIVSKDSSFKMSEKDFSGISDFSINFVKDNRDPLPIVYNKSLDEHRRGTAESFVILMHADVQLDAKKLIEGIERCKDKYDVFGLCGTEVMNVSQSPLNWYTSSRPTPLKRWGCVTHGELNNQTSFFSGHHPDVLDHEVACIDGLCIIFGPKALNTEIRFDERFMWDLYDTDISLQCVLQYKLKLGVLVHRELQHYSVGKSILSQDFLAHEKDFRDKWNLQLN